MDTCEVQPSSIMVIEEATHFTLFCTLHGVTNQVISVKAS